ncbi:hypothetical protein LNAOJCKE_5249 [Methylorubrum aminovorans]|uniref:Uncharacterized protein n=1 Tax=Methylorubrum aminovorans TaxID=269069 RepID=A0ABQ4ULW8_9HYPH|nr:hypothetical protein LNAOJCKE_5249 [Methylorubrum aminovorans]
MFNDANPTSQPISETWRLLAVILITAAGMLFTHAIT